MSSGVHNPCNRVSDRDNKDPIQFILRRQSKHEQRFRDGAQALVVKKEEQVVSNDRASNVTAELIAIRGWLSEWNRPIGTDYGRLEETGGVEIRIPNKFINRPMKLIAAGLCGVVKDVGVINLKA